MHAVNTKTAIAHGTLAQKVFAYLDLYKQRRALAKLTDAQLKDIGITRQEATNEATQNFWKAPESWTRSPSFARKAMMGKWSAY